MGSAEKKKAAKRMSQREKDQRARTKKMLQEQGVLPPDKPRLNRQKFAKEVWAEYEAMDPFRREIFLLKAVGCMVGPDMLEVTPEEVGVLKILKLAVEMDKFSQRLKAEGRDTYTLGELAEEVIRKVKGGSEDGNEREGDHGAVSERCGPGEDDRRFGGAERSKPGADTEDPPKGMGGGKPGKGPGGPGETNAEIVPGGVDRRGDRAVCGVEPVQRTALAHGEPAAQKLRKKQDVRAWEGGEGMRQANAISLKRARELAQRELGTAAGLCRTPETLGGHFEMRLGRLRVRIRPDMSGDTGCVELTVSAGGARLTRLFDPETLMEDLAAEERLRSYLRQEELECWVEALGPEKCRTEIERIWRELREGS